MSKFLVALLAVMACGSHATIVRQGTEAGAGPSQAASRASTNPLSEAEFKALHELPTGVSPALRGEMVSTGQTQAYLALPAGSPPFPTAIVIHEWWGLNDHVKHWADRLASAGWAAVAVDLYGGVVAADRDTAMNAMKSVNEATAHAVIADAIAFAKRDSRIQATKHVSIGWCFGGKWSMQTAISPNGVEDLDGAVVYYGSLPTDQASLAALQAPVLMIFGKQDPSLPQADVDRFATQLRSLGKHVDLHWYDAPHAFANPSNPTYDTVAAADAWHHVLAFLAKVKATP